MKTMGKSKIKSIIDYLSEPRKGIVVAVLVVMAIIAVVVVFRKTKGKMAPPPTLLNDDAIENGTGSAISPSIDFRSLAIRLFSACLGVGTNEDEVYAVMGCLNTQADYRKLSNVWMQQWNQLGLLAKTALPPSLPELLQSELDSRELSMVRSILSEKGIVPDF